MFVKPPGPFVPSAKHPLVILGLMQRGIKIFFTDTCTRLVQQFKNIFHFKIIPRNLIHNITRMCFVFQVKVNILVPLKIIVSFRNTAVNFFQIAPHSALHRQLVVYHLGNNNQYNNTDCYINVVGGLYLDEPAVDLTVALALVSSLKDQVVNDKLIAFGEIGLAGEIRAVHNCEQRVHEAVRLGFEHCVIPFHNYKSLPTELKKQADLIPVRTIRDAFAASVE